MTTKRRDNKRLSVRPLVSVLIPARDAERWVATAIDSILNQTYDEVEVIVIENGSSDRTLAVANRYRRDGVIVLSRSTGHLVAALNDGLISARGEFIARQDADDWSAPERIEAQLALLAARPTVGVCGCRYREVALDGAPGRLRPAFLEPEQIRTRLQTAMPFAGGSMLARRSVMHALGGFDAFFDGILGEDYDFLVRAAEITDIAAVDGSLYFRRLGNVNSMCGRVGRDYRSMFALVRHRAEHRGSNFFASAPQ